MERQKTQIVKSHLKMHKGAALSLRRLNISDDEDNLMQPAHKEVIQG